MTALCILGFIGSLVVIPTILNSGISRFFSVYLIVSSLVGLVCMVGFWKMKRWAVYTYIGMFVANQIILLVTGMWTIASLLLPLVFIAIILMYFSRMK